MKKAENYQIYKVTFGTWDSFNVQAKTMEEAIRKGRNIAKQREGNQAWELELTSCVVIADQIFK